MITEMIAADMPPPARCTPLPLPQSEAEAALIKERPMVMRRRVGANIRLARPACQVVILPWRSRRSWWPGCDDRNRDAADISQAIRHEMRDMGQLEEDKVILKVAMRGERDLQPLSLAAGDRVWLFNRVVADHQHFGSNGDTVTVLDACQVPLARRVTDPLSRPTIVLSGFDA